MKTIKWLHLSDLHFSIEDEYNQGVVAKSLLSDLEENINKKGLNLDFIFITGDLTKTGQKKEFSTFHKFLEKLIDITGVQVDRIIVVPGNHDINWTDVPKSLISEVKLINEREKVTKILGNKQERERYLVGFKNYFKYIKDTFPWAKKSVDGFSFTINHELKGIRFSFIALNSAWMAVNPSIGKGKLVLGERQVRDALERLDNPDIIISLMHHSFEWLQWFDKKDVKGMLERRTDFILSGHEHLEDLFRKISKQSDVIYISAGSLYDSRTYSNTYNIVELQFEKEESKVEFHQFVDRDGGFWMELNDKISDSFILPPRLLQIKQRILSLKNLPEDKEYQKLKIEKKVQIPQVPKDLIKKIINRECFLFAGAGTSMDAKLPNWSDLTLSLIDRVVEMQQFDKVDFLEINNLHSKEEYLVIAEACKKRLGFYEFSIVLKQLLTSSGRISVVHHLLSQIPFAGSITTNFDSFIESNKTNYRVVLPSELNELSQHDLEWIISNQFPIIKLHGTYDNAKSIILTHRDYNNLIFNNQNSKYRDNFRRLVSNKSMLFVGFSFRDPNVDFTLQEVFSYYKGESIPHYAILDDVGKIKSEYLWENYNIKAISLPVREMGWNCLIDFLQTLIEETSTVNK